MSSILTCITTFRAFSSKISKNLAFSISKTYFINFNNSLYKILNIKDFIFFTTSLKYYFFIIFYSQSHLFHYQQTHCHCQHPLPPLPIATTITTATTTTTTTTHNLNPQPPKKKKKTKTKTKTKTQSQNPCNQSPPLEEKKTQTGTTKNPQIGTSTRHQPRSPPPAPLWQSQPTAKKTQNNHH